MQINIKTNAINAKHYFDSMARSQLPFAISKALNGMAYDARDENQADIGKYFKLRTNWLTKKGAMPVVPSKKSQFPNIHAIIGVKDETAALSATGGKKQAHNRDMAVPFEDSGDGQGTRDILSPGKGTLGPSKWPSRLLKQGKTKRRKGRNGTGQALLNLAPKPFILQGKAGRTFMAIRSGKDNSDLKILYEMKRDVEVLKRWPLVDNVTMFIAMNYDDYLSRALKAAVASARR